jgi:hypothetical protein
MSLRRMVQAMSESLADARHKFERSRFFNRRSRRDELLVATAYGVQNCLRSLAMLHSDGAAPGLVRAVAMHRKNTASAIEAQRGETHASLSCTVANCFLCEREAGGSTEGESPVGSADAPNPRHKPRGSSHERP